MIIHAILSLLQHVCFNSLHERICESLYIKFTTWIYSLQSLQSKYDSLVRRLDELDEENNALQSELSALADEKEQLEASLSELNKQPNKQVSLNLTSYDKKLAFCISLYQL